MTTRRPRLPRHPPTPRELGELAQLLFEWPIRQAPRLTLPLCILAAAMIQVAVVVLFSIRYDVPEEKAPPQPHFYFLPPDSPVARNINPWLEAHDPSVFSPLRATEMAVPSPPPLKYRPSYEDPPPPLRTLPALEETVSGPPNLPLSGETQRVTVVTRTSAPLPLAPAAIATRVQWLDGLAKLSPVGDERADPPLLPHAPPVPRPSLYQVAVSPEGIPLSCVLTEPSGDAEADESGRVWILSRRFLETEGLSWGRVLLLWGGAPASTHAPSAP